jgi:hypothetical protein
MNIVQKIFLDSETSKIRSLWRGHLFLFDKPPAPGYSAQAGTRLLLLFFVLEIVIRPLGIVSAQALGITEDIWWPLVQVMTFTLVAGWLVSKFAKVPLSQLGLYSWNK